MTLSLEGDLIDARARIPPQQVRESELSVKLFA
jgi:hypothetical protein